MTRRVRLAAAVWLSAAALFTRSLAGQGKPAAPPAQKVDRRSAVTSDVYVRFAGALGRLQVTGWGVDSLAIIGTLPPGVRTEFLMGGDGKSPARGVKLFVETANEALAAAGALELKVPYKARVWIKVGTATVEVRDVAGGVDVNTMGGSVRVTGAPRELQVEAMDATVVLEGAPIWCRAKTAAGDITLRGSCTDLALTSVSGTLRVEGGPVERGRLETVTGAIAFAATPSPAASLTFDSHSGAIDLRLPARGDFTFLGSSITGAVENRYDHVRPTAGREGRGSELTIERGSGSARLTARSFKGTITAGR